jgi:hypothetical protein
MRNSKLFKTLYACKDEFELHEFISSHPALFDDSNWKPLGDNKSNYGVVKNQQSNPIAALLEKATNSIDALLTKKYLELEIDPKSSDAPETMDEVVARFFLENN